MTTEAKQPSAEEMVDNFRRIIDDWKYCYAEYPAARASLISALETGERARQLLEHMREWFNGGPYAANWRVATLHWFRLLEAALSPEQGKEGK